MRSACALVLVVVACSHPRPHPAAAPPVPAKTRLVRLDNGLTVAMYRNPRAPFVKIGVRYEVGTTDDPIDKPGLAAVAAALMLDARVAPGEPTFADRLAPITLLGDYELGPQSLALLSIANPGHLDEILAIEADRLNLRCDGIDDEAVAAATARAIDDPDRDARADAFRRVVARAVYGADHPFARDSTPKPGAISARDACDLVTARWGADAAHVTIAGNLDLDHTEQTVRRVFGASRTAAMRQPTLAPALAAGRAEITADVERTLVVISVPGPVPGDIDSSLRFSSKMTPRDTAVVVGQGPSQALALVLSADADAIDTTIDRGTQILDSFARRSRFAFSSMTDGLWAESSEWAFECLELDPTWVVGEPRPAPPAVAWIPDPVRVTIVHPSATGQLRIPAASPDRALFGRSTRPGHPAPSTPIEVPTVAAAHLERRTLSNGLRIVQLSQPDTTTAAAELVIPIGDRDGPVAHAAAGSIDTGDDDDLLTVIAESDAVATWSATAGYASEQPAVVERLWRYLQAELDGHHPTSTEDFLDSSRACGPGRFRRGLRPVALALGRNPSAGAAPDDSTIVEFRRHHYRPDVATLVVVGEPGDDVDAAIERTFGAWTSDPAGPANLGGNFTPPRAGASWIAVDQPDVDSATIVLAFSRSSDPVRDQAALTIIDRVLGGSTITDDTFVTRREVDRTAVRAEVEKLLGLVTALRTDPGTLGTVLDLARRNGVVDSSAWQDTPALAAMVLGSIASHDLPDDYVQRLANEIVTISPDEIADVARADLDPAHMTVVIVGPRADIEPAFAAAGARADQVTWEPTCPD